MPELPEVQTVVNGIFDSIVNQKFSNIDIYRRDLRISVNDKVDKFAVNSEILSVKRRSKYILIYLENSHILIIHLGMSGKLTINESKNYQPLKHDHLVFEISNGKRLVFNDARRFGLVICVTEQEFSKHKLFAKLGVEPLTDNLSVSYLKNKLKNKSLNIKQAIMDANIVVGVGNIYASESLFKAKISPTRPANRLDEKELSTLISEIKEILKLAIKAGGSTLKDFTQSSGQTGYFQFNFNVYGKDGEKCNLCNNKIVRIKQSGRSTFYCEYCQK